MSAKWHFVVKEWKESLPLIIEGNDPLLNERAYNAHTNMCAFLDDFDCDQDAVEALKVRDVRCAA